MSIKRKHFVLIGILFLFNVNAIICANSNNQVTWFKTSTIITASENEPELSNLMDNDVTTGWSTTTGSGWIVYKTTGDTSIVNGYVLHAGTGSSIPQSWRVKASVDSLSFDVLDEQTSQTFSDNQRKSYEFSNTNKYNYYVLEFFGNDDLTAGASSLSISGLYLTIKGYNETFDNLNISASATDVSGSFTGEHGIKWSYTRSRDGQTYGAEGKSIIMRGQDGATLTANSDSGISFLSLDYTLAFGSGSNEIAYIEVVIDNQTTGISKTVAISDSVGNTITNGIKTLIVDEINEPGKVEIKILAKNKPVNVDNVAWSPYINPDIYTKEINKYVPARVNAKYSSTHRSVEVLNGSYLYEHDHDNAGEQLGWHKDGVKTFTNPFNVPGTIKNNGYANNPFNESIRWKEIGSQVADFTNSWYRKEFITPTYDLDTQRVWLKIGGIHPACKIWINDQFVTSHYYPDLSFKCDVTPLLNTPGQANTMIVEIIEDLGARASAGHMNKNTYWSGIFRDVEIEVTNEVILQHLQITTDIATKVVTTKVEIESDTTDFTGKIVLNITNSDAVIETFTQAGVNIKRGMNELEYNSTLTNALKFWYPESPELYTCEVVIYDASDNIIDSYKEDFGFRELTVIGQKMFLNGDYLYLRGCGDLNTFPETGCPPVDREYYRTKIQKLKSLGFNHVRHHSMMPVDEYLEVANEEGILVQAEMAVIGQWSANVNYDAKLVEWEYGLKRTYNNPSLAIYCMGNEGWYKSVMTVLYDMAKDMNAEQFIIATAHHEGDKSIAASDIIETNVNYSSKPYFRHEYCHSSSVHDTAYQGKYKGFTPEGNIWFLDDMIQKAESVGNSDRLEDFRKYSHLYQEMNRKSSIEFFRQDKVNADGYSLWMGLDSEYAMGYFNNHSELKEGVTTEQVVKYNSDVVLLNKNDVATDDQGNNDLFGADEVNLRKRILESGGTLNTTIVVQNSSYSDFSGATVKYEIKDYVTGEVLSSDSVININCSAGGYSNALVISDTLPTTTVAKRLLLSATIDVEGKTYINDWFYMLYPSNGDATAKVYFDATVGTTLRNNITNKLTNLVVVNDINSLGENGVLISKDLTADVRNHLEDSGRVLLLAKGVFDEYYPDVTKERRKSKYATFLMGSTYFGAGHIFGNIVNNEKVLETNFPFADSSLKFIDIGLVNTLWWAPVMNLTAMNLNGAVDNVVECIPHYKSQRQISFMFQVNAGAGKLIATTLTLVNLNDADSRNVLNSLINYTASSDFNPSKSMSISTLFSKGSSTQGKVSYTQNMEEGTVKLFNSSNVEQSFDMYYNTGANLYVTAVAPDGYVVSNMHSSQVAGTFDKEKGKYSFTVPAKNVTVQVEYDEPSNLNRLESDDVNLYPVPVHAEIKITGLEGFAKDVTIYNLAGAAVKVFINSYSDSFVVEDMNNGVYLVEIKSRNNIYKKTIIKK